MLNVNMNSLKVSSGVKIEDINFGNNKKVAHFINEGTIGQFSVGSSGEITRLDNYGYILSKGTMKENISASGGRISIGNYNLKITQTANEFLSGKNKNDMDISHLVLSNTANNGNGKVMLADSQSKFILSFGENFEFNTDYKLDKLITNANGGKYDLTYVNSNTTLNNNQLFSHLLSQSPSFYITKHGDYFRVNFDENNTLGSVLHKNNIKTMNNLLLYTNAFAFNNRKSRKLKLANSNRFPQNLIASGNDRNIASLRESEAIYKNTDFKDSTQNENLPYNLAFSANDFMENDRFYYQNESKNNRRRRNNNYLAPQNPQPKAQNQSQNIQSSQQIPQSTNSTDKKYDFFFMPFITHNMFFESNGTGFSGLSYGFMSGFSGKIDNSNELGVHFGFDYGKIDDGNVLDGALKRLEVGSISFMGGLHYRLDLPKAMYIKALGDAFYFMNDMNLIGVKFKPNQLGFSLSAAWGMDFNLKEAGVIGIEAGMAYQGLQSNSFATNYETYDKTLLHLAYLDIQSAYEKEFDNGLVLGSTLGLKALLTTPSANIKIAQTPHNFKVGTDRILGYLGLGLGYNIKDIVRLDLDYLGSFGDKAMSNSGFFNVRVWW